MSLKKIFSLFLVCSFMFVSIASANVLTFGYTDEASFVKERKADLKATKDAMEKIRIQLELAIVDFLGRVDDHGSATRNKPDMKPHPSGKNHFYYSEIDKSHIQIEITPSKSKHADYFAKIRYTEVFYEALSDSKNHKDSEFKRVSSRRVTELARYHKGKWYY